MTVDLHSAVRTAVDEARRPQFWHVTWPVLIDGLYVYEQTTAANEDDARLIAAYESRRHHHAIVTNREGLAATYVFGETWPPVAAAFGVETGETP